MSTRVQPNLSTAALRRTGSNYRVFFSPGGVLPAYSLGNVVSLTPDFKNTTVATQLNDPTERAIINTPAVVTEVSWGYDVEVNEFPDIVLQLIERASITGNSSQSLNNSGTASISSAVPGGWYSLGAYNVSTVVVTVSSATKTEGVDYVVDYAAGMIYITNNGGITSGAAVSITFVNPALAFASFTGNPQPSQTGSFQVVEFDQQTLQSRSVKVFTGTIYLKSGPTKADGKTAQMVTLRIDADKRPTTVLER